VRVRVTSQRGGRFARGTIETLVRPAPVRVEPACVHYTRDRCGGCQLQHMGYAAQLDAKRAIVQDALTRIARRDVADVTVAPSPRLWRYRRKLTLAVERTGAGRWVAGLHRFDAPSEIFPLEDCPITERRVVDTWAAITRVAHWLPDASQLRAAVRTTDDGLAFVVEGGRRWPNRASFVAAVPALTEIWWAPAGATRRRVAVPREMSAGVIAGDTPSAAPDPSVHTGASFAQVNAEMSAVLHGDVVRRTLAYAPATVVDAYAGSGETAIALARRGVRVTAIEADREAVGRCASALPSGSAAIAARVEDALGAALPADVIVLNPPRAGLSTAVTALLGSAVPRARAIIYVSCDPATLARDLARLSGWRLVAVQAYDMFPQTAHVETLCELVPDEIAA
jgi:23S rRNA (uracil1939-C5)-methyltransferase